MLALKMGPQLMPEGIVPMSAPPTRARHVSSSSTGSHPDFFQFPLISQFTDMPSTSVGKHTKLDRSTSEPNPQNKLQPTSQGKNVLNPSRYKTEICRPFSENGFCKYGDKCQFAHGSQDLRGLPRHPKYKTELCRTFHTVGFCPYGPRCHFIHSEDEGKLVEINTMKQQQAAQQAAREMAQLQAQQQALEVQLKALVSQVQFTSHMVHPGVGQLGGQTNRPRLQHSISVHPQLPDHLGSTGDSPAESTCSGGSPVLSPVFTEDSVSDANSDSLCCMLTPPVSADSSFSFPGGELSPLNMSPARLPHQYQPQRTVSLSSSNLEVAHTANANSGSLASSLRSSLQGLSLGGQSESQSVSSPVFSPSHSPDQLINQCGTAAVADQSSPADPNIHARLPIFTRLAQKS